MILDAANRVEELTESKRTDTSPRLIILRDYQREAAEWLRRRKRGMVVAPAGSGKTIIAAGALNMALAHRRVEMPRVGWLANTVEQCQQAERAIHDVCCQSCCVRIACAASQSDWSDCHLLIVDECHHATAPGWAAQIATCKASLWGFTATPDIEDEERNKALHALFGEVFTVDRSHTAESLARARVVLVQASDANTRERIDAEIARLLPIRRRQMRGAPVSEGELFRMVSWQACVSIGIVDNAARNAMALRVAMSQTRPTLVLVNQVDHAIDMAECIPGARAVYAKMGKVKRRWAIEDFKAGRLRCLVATSLADEGLDLPMASVLVLVSGGRSKAKTEQRTGRVLRLFAGKQGAVIYDFEDRQHPLMEKHARARQALYRELGYAIERLNP